MFAQPQLHLFNTDLSSPQSVDNLTDQAASLIHTTRVHGGFWDLTVLVAGGIDQYWQWLLERLRYRAVLETYGGHHVFEGRLEDVGLEDRGIRLRWLGYWSDLTDNLIDRAGNLSTTYSAQTALQIITDLLQNHGVNEIDTTDVTHIDNPGVSLTVTYEDMYLWDCLVDPDKGVAHSTDADGDPYFFGVWDNRIAYFTERDLSGVDWTCSMADLDSMPYLTGSLRNVRNNIFAVYDSAGTRTATAASQDTDSDARFAARDGLVRNIGESNAATAQNMRDRMREEMAGLRAETDAIHIKRIYDARGVEWPLCHVRAGDVLRITDLVSRAVGLSTPELDALQTFFVRETICNHDNATLSIVPDKEDVALHKALGRAKVMPRRT